MDLGSNVGFWLGNEGRAQPICYFYGGGRVCGLLVPTHALFLQIEHNPAWTLVPQPSNLPQDHHLIECCVRYQSLGHFLIFG